MGTLFFILMIALVALKEFVLHKQQDDANEKGGVLHSKISGDQERIL